MGTNLLGFLITGSTGVLIGLSILGSAMAVQQARHFRAARYLFVAASVLAGVSVLVFVWSLIASGSLMVAGLAVGAALGSGVGVAVAFALVLTSQWSNDLYRYASAAYTATSTSSRVGSSLRSASGLVPPGYPAGYPSPGYPPSSMPPGVYRDPRWQ